MKTGDWVKWHLPGVFLRQGQITRKTDVSLELMLVGHDRPTVIPVADYYLEHGLIEVIPEPPRAARIAQATEAHVMPPERAAALLGISLKRLRAQLREGRLQGRQVDGRWVEVDLG